ncbi:hypothetical protein MR626_10685 [bacterium]|nr:hypothetical protein [bacterium]
MRILVYGAGVLGGNLACNLYRAKQDVTLLARGSWAQMIQKNGLILRRKFRPKPIVCRRKMCCSPLRFPQVTGRRTKLWGSI